MSKTKICWTCKKEKDVDLMCLGKKRQCLKCAKEQSSKHRNKGYDGEKKGTGLNDNGSWKSNNDIFVK